MHSSERFEKIIFICIFLMTPLMLPELAIAQAPWSEPNPRIIVTADPELDDNNSLIRLLLHSNELTIEGLIYASSQFHWKGDGKGTKWFVPGREYDRFGLSLCPCESWRWADDERFIHDIVEAYEEVYPNLKVHDPDYPSPEYLKSRIRYGNINFDGDFSADTEGSKLIESLIMDEKPGKLFITAWGGASTIARALLSIQQEFQYTDEWDTIKEKISRKVVLLPSGDQDDTFIKYIRPNWPDIEYRRFRNGPSYGYGAQLNATPENARYLTSEWMTENVTSRGPLGELYRVWGDGKQMVKDDKFDYFGLEGYSDEELRKMGYVVWMPVQSKGSWLGEGDNHTFMNMLGNGLEAYKDPFYGGWGGRGIGNRPTASLFSMPEDSSSQSMAESLAAMNSRNENEANPFPNFFPDAQNDFAARLKWSVTGEYDDANHAPTVDIAGPKLVMASPGQRIRLNGVVSDPDDNDISVRWWQFHSGTYDGAIDISSASSMQAETVIPDDVQPGQTIHIILEANDNGTPAITRYDRLIIKIRYNED